ncbi:hypothetical protein LFML04_2089 [Leptospirillum ferriphilum ML-04]|uniref:Uncharacterized protein n=1 Tax=Leptospirillum ferriphilum (strain ML-04) TaxID=1048260 RepID=J9ZCF7_LEPFM|nr:hypothetical protein LFML04_2089 [Leptospirillum ferriphilum ML-04]
MSIKSYFVFITKKDPAISLKALKKKGNFLKYSLHSLRKKHLLSFPDRLK